MSKRGRYSKSTMRNWTKAQLIDYIEVCEHNERIMAETLEQQARNFEQMLKNLKEYKDPVEHILGGSNEYKKRVV